MISKKEIEPWISILNEGNIVYLINCTRVKYRPLVAAAFSVAKWHPYNFNRGSGSGGNCGFCVFYTQEFAIDVCGECPLVKAGQCCNDADSYWSLARGMSFKKNADKLYKLILEIYTEEYERMLG